jgi:metallo-beta-lactamase family protein
MTSRKAVLTFCGGTGTVTGANFLLEIDTQSLPSAGENTKNPTKKILIDCGLEQGSEFADASNREDFPFSPADIDILLITHAHTDHIGRIPKLVHEGFRGVIYSTPATLDIAKLMLPDTLHLLEIDARKKGVLALYEQEDVDNTFPLWKTINYYESFDLGDGVSVYPKDSGHILGAAMFEISINNKKIVFTGDLGNSPSLFLRDTDVITDAKYLLMESVYGDRNHESKTERKEKLIDVIKDTIARNRTLIIPAFSLERTQDIIFEINDLVERNVIGDIKVFIDSPLATHVTEVYKTYSKDFNESARDMIAQGDDLFNFPRLKFTLNKQESEHIDRAAVPKIIIGGSGMSNGGRIVKHEKHYLPDANTTLLLVGYQSLGTLGRKILDGAKKLHIDGEDIKVRAEIKSIMGYSSHKDSDHLTEFAAQAAESGKLDKVFVVMGEPKSALFLVQKLRDNVGINAVYPQKGDSVDLEF